MVGDNDCTFIDDTLISCLRAGSRYLEPDGTFPNHSPNPEDKEAMKAGSEAVQQSGSDLGIVVDTVRALSPSTFLLCSSHFDKMFI